MEGDGNPGGGTSNPARLLIAVGAAALVVALVMRALTEALDLSPVVAILIAWALLTAGFVAYGRLRRRREAGETDSSTSG